MFRKGGLVTALLLALGAGSLAHAAADPALVKARQMFFGIENVDVNTGMVKKDKVILSWATNTTYVASVLGRVILLDSYINRPELKPAGLDIRRTPFLPQDLVALKPEAIFLGHGHGDHADNAAYIAKLTGAKVYASAETCAGMQNDINRMFNDPNAHNGGAKIIPDANPINCVSVVPAGSQPGQYTGTLANPFGGTTTVTRLTQLDPQVCILAFKFIHSGTAPADASFTHTPLNNLGDPRYAGRVIDTPAPAITYPAMYPTGTPYTPPGNVANRVAGQLDTRTGGAGGSITIFYQFVLRGGYNFSFAWLNSAGPAKEGIGADPGLVSLATYNAGTNVPAITLAGAIGQSLFDLMDRLPLTDAFYGSIVSLGATANQQRDIIEVIRRLKPRQYVPGHITDVAQAGSGLYHLINWKQTATAMGFPQAEWPDLRMLLDPNDFAVPQVYSPGDARWSNPAKAARVAQFCS